MDFTRHLPKPAENPLRSYEWFQAEGAKAERLANRKAVALILLVAALLALSWSVFA